MTNCGFAEIEIVSTFSPARLCGIRKIELSENFSRFVPGSFREALALVGCLHVEEDDINSGWMHSTAAEMRLMLMADPWSTTWRVPGKEEIDVILWIVGFYSIF